MGSTSETLSAPSGGAANPAEIWQQILQQVARENPSLAANLAKCRLKRIADQAIEIEVHGNGFTLNMIQREKNTARLVQICEGILGRRHEIKFTSASNLAYNKLKKKKASRLKQKALSHPLVADAVEIFNGKLIDVKIL